jgi:hypothetical protein
MKKSIIFLAILFCAASLSANAQDKIIGEKGKEKVIGEKIIGEKNVANQQVSKAAMLKYKSEIERLSAEYLKKQAAAESAANALRKKIEEAMKAMEADGKMGNFEIQNLMSEFNQAETLSSQVQKKREETKKAVIGKL